jgi:hypothetical protein
MKNYNLIEQNGGGDWGSGIGRSSEVRSVADHLLRPSLLLYPITYCGAIGAAVGTGSALAGGAG